MERQQETLDDRFKQNCGFCEGAEIELKSETKLYEALLDSKDMDHGTEMYRKLEDQHLYNSIFNPHSSRNGYGQQ